jgi:hypothetical protein
MIYVRDMFNASTIVPPDDDALYQTALAIEQDKELASEMAEWEVATAHDGLIAEPDRRHILPI